MRKLLFAHNINGTDATGLVDVSKNPPQLFCLCDENVANEILSMQKHLDRDALAKLANQYQMDALQRYEDGDHALSHLHMAAQARYGFEDGYNAALKK